MLYTRVISDLIFELAQKASSDSKNVAEDWMAAHKDLGLGILISGRSGAPTRGKGALQHDSQSRRPACHYKNGLQRPFLPPAPIHILWDIFQWNE